MATKPLDWSKRALADRDSIYAETASMIVAYGAREAVKAATKKARDYFST